MKFQISTRCFNYLLVAIVMINPSQAQIHTGWEVLSSGIGFGVENLYFLDSQIGFSTIDHDGVRSSLIRTTNGGLSWNSSFSEFGYVTSVHFPAISIGYISFNGDGNKIFRSSDLGLTWDLLSSKLGFGILSLCFTDTLIGYAGGGVSGGASNGRIAKTTDGGISWVVTALSISIRSIHFPSPDTGYAIGGDQSSSRIYKTTDAGLSWNPQNVPPGSGTLLQVRFADNNIGYIVSRSSSPFNGYIIKTENGGNNWFIQHSLSDIPLNSISVADENIVYVVGYYGTILKTTNGGLHWYSQGSQTSEILRSVFFVDSLRGYASGGSYSATPSHIILRTTSGGEPIIPVELTSFTTNIVGSDVHLFWTTASELNNMGFELFRNENKITFIEGKGTTTETQSYSYKDNNLRPAIYNYRLEQIDFDGTRSVLGELTIHFSIPETFSLKQNYPNPFNPTTVISWQLPVVSQVTLKAYDALGKNVAVLVDEMQQAGRHQINFDAGDLPSGLYLCRLQAGDERRVIKLLLIK